MGLSEVPTEVEGCMEFDILSNQVIRCAIEVQQNLKKRIERLAV